MSGEDKKIRIELKVDQPFFDGIEQDAQQRGFKDRTTYITDAIKHFQKCKEKESAQAMKEIITKYPGKCLKCGQEIPVNSWAMFGRGVGLICLDCVVLKLGDKTIVAKYLTNRKLDRVAKALKEECDKLAGKVEELQVLSKAEDLKNQQESAIKTVLDFLTHRIGTPDENKALEEFLRQLKDGKRIIMDMDEFLKSFVRNRKWRKQVLAQHEEVPEQESEEQT
jgi:hypothetical protein